MPVSRSHKTPVWPTLSRNPRDIIVGVADQDFKEKTARVLAWAPIQNRRDQNTGIVGWIELEKSFSLAMSMLLARLLQKSWRE
jgi:hypothetical protein